MTVRASVHIGVVALIMSVATLSGEEVSRAEARPGASEAAAAVVPPFIWEYPDEIARVVVEVVRDADALTADIYGQLGIAPVPGVVVRIARDHADFLKLAPSGVRFPPWSQGITLPSQNEIYLTVFDADGNLVDLPTVFKHEVSHVAVFVATGEGRAPRWFVEGFAILQAEEYSLGRVDALARSAIGEGVSLRLLDRAFHGHAPSASAAYAAAADFVRYYRGLCGTDALPRVVSRVRAGSDFYAEMGTACGEEVTFDGLEAGWQKTLVERYPWWRMFASDLFLWVGGALFLVFGFFVVRRRRRARLARWSESEYRYDAAVDRAVAATEERERRSRNARLQRRRTTFSADPPPERSQDDQPPPGGWLH